MEELEDLLRVVSSPAYFFDISTHQILCVNAAFARLMGYSAKELEQMLVDDLRLAEDVPKLNKALAQAPPEGWVEWRYRTQGGELIYVQITYRNSIYVDKRTRTRRDVRLVVISKSGPLPTISGEEELG